MINYLMTIFSFKGELNSSEYISRYKKDLIIITIFNIIWFLVFLYNLPTILDYAIPVRIFDTNLGRVLINLAFFLLVFFYSLNRCSLTYRRLSYLKKNRYLSIISLLFPLSMYFEATLFSDEQY